MEIVKIYTDGACSGNQYDKNVGGWGTILEYGSHRKELHGGEKNTTNNRMEMMALLQGFSALKKDNLTIEVYSDSSYLMDCFRKKWYSSWLKNGWKTASKKPVENKDLWEKLLPYLSLHTISFYRVKGHVHLDHPNVNGDSHYKKFLEWNGSSFTYNQFAYITAQNNRADALANLGMEPFQEN